MAVLHLEKQHVLSQPGSLDLVLEALEEIFWPVFKQMNWKKGMKISVSVSVGTNRKSLLLLEIGWTRIGTSWKVRLGNVWLSSSSSEKAPGAHTNCKVARIQQNPIGVRKPVRGHLWREAQSASQGKNPFQPPPMARPCRSGVQAGDLTGEVQTTGARVTGGAEPRALEEALMYNIFGHWGMEKMTSAEIRLMFFENPWCTPDKSLFLLLHVHLGIF